MEQEVFPKFEKEITDQIFLFIENDKELLNQYHDVLSESEARQLKCVHSNIAQMIADRYGLEKNGVKVNEPKSKLIQTYSQLKKK